MKASFLSSYRKSKIGQNPVVVFRYAVEGSEEDIQKYSEIQGDNLVLDDKTGKPLYFTTRYISDSINLIITENNRVVADDSEIVKLQSLVQTYGLDVAKLMLGK